MQRQPHRITITISFQVYQELLSRSEEEGRSMSNLCAYLLETSLHHATQSSTKPAQPAVVMIGPSTASSPGNGCSTGS
jgi:hypothetical protein